MGFLWTFDGEEVPNVESAQRGGPQRNSTEHSYPGVNGIDSVDHGFRGESFTLQCWDLSATPEATVQSFRAKVGTVGVLSSGRPGFTDLNFVRLDNVSEGRFETGDDNQYLVEFTLTLKQIKEND